jgi:hypothetical protein
MTAQNLMTWVIRWCSQPGMYLVGPSNRECPSIHNVWWLMTGYLAGAGPEAAFREWNEFEMWLARTHPACFREGGSWFGEAILEQAGGDHWKAAAELKRLAEEYQRSRPG